MWQLSVPVEVQAQGDSGASTGIYLIWVEVSGLAPTLLTEDTIGLIGETIRPVLSLDPHGLRVANPRVRVSHPLNESVRLSQGVRVSPLDDSGRRNCSCVSTNCKYGVGDDFPDYFLGLWIIDVSSPSFEETKEGTLGLEKSLAGVQLAEGSGSKKRVHPRGSHNKPKLDAPKDTEVPELEED
ncbi:hypothetical protein ACLB2K_037684 [Fragaria x ananassa]